MPPARRDRLGQMFSSSMKASENKEHAEQQERIIAGLE